MIGTGKWIAGGLLGLLGILGLFMSANAADAQFYYLGIGVFVTCVGAIMLMVHTSFNAVERAVHAHPMAAPSGESSTDGDTAL